jgi:hypothetical protein
MVMLLEHLVLLLTRPKASTLDTVLMRYELPNLKHFTGLTAGTYTVTLQDAKVVLLLIRLQLVNRILLFYRTVYLLLVESVDSKGLYCSNSYRWNCTL